MKTPDLTQQVLACANKVAGLNLSIGSDEDVPLEAFQFDSLSLFAFVVELERVCGISFDDAIQNYENLRTVRSTAAFIESRKHALGSAASSATN
jgi:acyl carrier protein